MSGRTVGTGRLLGQGRIRPMAVARAWRHGGVVRALLDALLARARVALHAQATAIGFYERSGFVTEGPAFIEAGIRHCRMHRRLNRA